MATVLITALVVFVSTSLDDLVLILLFLGQSTGAKERRAIVSGHLLAILLLLGISIFGAYFAKKLLEDWVLGLLGFIPILLAIKALTQKDGEQNEHVNSRPSHIRLGLGVASVLLASGSDNLGMYIPWFATLNLQAIAVVAVMFLLLVVLFFYIAQALATISTISMVLNRFSKILVPFVFLLLGGSILAQMGTFTIIMHLFSR